MKRELKKQISVVLVLILVVSMVLSGMPVVSKASETGSFTEMTFADFDMDGSISGGKAFDTKLSTWDKIALNGEVTFGSTEWDTVLAIGGIGTKDWYGINLVPMKDGLYISSPMCDSTGTTGYTIKIGEGTDLLIGNDAFGGESLLGKTVKLRLTFLYTDAGIKMGITINDNFIQEVSFGASVENADVTAKDVIGSSVLGYNIAVSSKKTEKEPIEYKEVTFADFDMDGTIFGGATFDTKISTWDKVALSGEVTFGSAEWDTVLIIGGIGTKDWYGINLVPMKDGLYISSPMCDSTGTTGYTIKIGEGTDLLIGNDAFGGESLLGKTVKLRLTFLYTDAGIKMGITINDNFIQEVSFGASVENADITAKDVIGSSVLGYNIAVSSKKTEKEPIEYKEVTFADFDMDGSISGGKAFDTKLSTWDKVALSGEVTFGSAEWDTVLIIGGIGTKDWYGINLVPMKDGLYISSPMCDSTGTTGYTIKIGEGTDLLIGNDAFGGESLLGKTVKLRLTFLYTDAGIKMGITINDNFIQEVSFGASVENADITAKDVIGSSVLGYNITLPSKEIDDDSNKPGGSDNDEDKIVDYRELSFTDIGMQGTISGSQVFDTKLSTWDKVALSGEVIFGNTEWDTVLVIGGTGTKDWLGIQLVPVKDGLYITCPMNDVNENGHTIKVGDSTELLISNSDMGVNGLLGAKVKLRLTFLYTETGIKMGVKINDKFVGYITLGTDVNNDSITVKDVIGSYVLGYNVTVLSEAPKDEGSSKSPQELGYKEITINSFSLPHNAIFAPGKNEENHRFANYVRPSLDKTYLNMDVAFESDKSVSYINYASADGWRGINIRAKDGALHFTNADTGAGVAYTAEVLGLTKLTEKFNLKIGIEMGSFHDRDHWSGKVLPHCDEIKMSIWVNDKLIARDVIFKDVAMAGNGIGIYTLESAITIGTPRSANIGIDFSLFGYTKDWKQEIKKQ